MSAVIGSSRPSAVHSTWNEYHCRSDEVNGAGGAASGGDFSPGSPVEKYNQASGYLRQVLAWIGIKDVEIILAGRARAGAAGETAVDQFGAAVRSAAAGPPAVAA